MKVRKRGRQNVGKKGTRGIKGDIKGRKEGKTCLPAFTILPFLP
jgi:hypothetical protein